MGDSELEPLYLSPFVNNSGYQVIRRERAVNSLSSALYFWMIYFFWGGGGFVSFSRLAQKEDYSKQLQSKYQFTQNVSLRW